MAGKRTKTGARRARVDGAAKKPASSSPSSTTVDAKSEGQRRLLEVDASLSIIAKAVGCSKALAGFWRSGAKLPSSANRVKLRDVYGIPPTAWDAAPGASISGTKAEEPLDYGSDGDTLEMTNGTIAALRRALSSADLSDASRSKKEDSLAKLLALKARLERDRELVEDRVVREHPAWRRIKETLGAALQPYPDAAKAVAEALKGIDG